MLMGLKLGQSLDLTELSREQDQFMIEIQWKSNDIKRKGLLSFLHLNTQECRYATTVLLLEEGEKLRDKRNKIALDNLRHPTQCIRHMGDQITQSGYQDEQIFIKLSNIPDNIQYFNFVLHPYQLKKGKLPTAVPEDVWLRVVHTKTQEEILKIPLLQHYAQTNPITLFQLIHDHTHWKLNILLQSMQSEQYGL